MFSARLLRRRVSRSIGHVHRLVAYHRGSSRPLSVEALEERTLLSAGDLDPTFGSGGLVTTDFGSASETWRAIAIQSDGKIVVTGNSGSDVITLGRYNTNGTLDSSFGVGGRVTTDFNKNYGGEYAHAIAIQPDGKIIAVADIAIASKGGSAIAMARYNPNGTLDTAFGGPGAKGKVITDLGAGTFDTAYAIAIQPNGKIVLAGNKNVDSNNNFFAVLRYNSTGTLDTSFGSGGVVLTDLTPLIPNVQPGYDVAYSVAIQTDGKIVAAGSANGGSVSVKGDFGIVRYNANGSLDASFGTGGIVLTDILGTGQAGDGARSVLIQSDGKLVVAGTATGFPDQKDRFAVARYDSNGSLDASFGSGGIVATDVITGNDDRLSGAALQSNGKIVAVGYTTSGICCNLNFAMVRYTAAGALDTTFGSNGVVTTDFSGGDDRANGVAIQSDGKIVAAGQSSGNFALARYLGDGSVAAMVASRNTVSNVDAVIASHTNGDHGSHHHLLDEIAAMRDRLHRMRRWRK